MDKIYFGIDIGGTTVKIGCFDETGRMHLRYEIPTDKSNDGENILKDIADSILKTMKDEKLDINALKGVGIGVPGPVKDDGTVLKCVNLGWGIINVPQLFRQYIDVKTAVGNDANMAALGEMFMGGAKGYDDVVMITLGTGVGGGIIHNGRIVNGTNGAAGEIGHMPVVYDEDMPLCNCGKKGCLEQVASATGIVNETRKILKKSNTASSLRDIENFTAKDVFDAAKAGDTLAGQAVERLAWFLGTAMANISCVMDPQVFVIGGGVSRAGDILTDSVSKVYKEKAFNPSKGTKTVLATLGNDAGMYGAVKLVL